MTAGTDPTSDAAPSPAPPSVLVLGADLQLRSVISHAWHEIPDDLNVVDFDVVVLNYVPLEEPNYANSIDTDSLPPTEQLIRHFFDGQTVTMAIGPPDLTYGRPLMKARADGFVPVRPATRKESGTEFTLDAYEGELNGYFECVDRWSWYCAPSSAPNDAVFDRACELLSVHANVAIPDIRPIATNRKGEPVAFEMRADLWHLDEYGTNELLKTSGRLLWFPSPTRCASDEAIRRLLTSVGIGAESPPPSWTADYLLPRHTDAAERVDSIAQRITDLGDELAQARRELDVEARFVHLLYEQGEPLEDVVHDALRELGADITRPETSGGNDGHLIEPAGRRGVLEIKGKSGVIGVRDMRQLRHWVTQAETDDPGTDFKGLFVANAHRDAPVDERSESYDINAAKLASRWGLALITTTQLFQALRNDQKGELDREAFWDAVFDANGIVTVDDPT